ncbi:restriction system protein [Maledivibacter halophilus]|uniref:Restriction system protein n=2 Tax=Maledivibacter halophilus TaxID=36842 RepID=A0A1T5KYH8_9FIRM|nr:restriction system protein [Maledivibacter halophilus]
MSIPDYKTLMLPLLKFANDKKEHSLRDAINYLADKFELTEDEKNKLLPSGKQAIFNNRVGWARTYLKKAGLIEYIKRGIFKITDRGLEVLSENPKKLTNAYLKKFPEFKNFKEKSSSKKDDVQISSDTNIEETPEERLENAYHIIRDELSQSLISQVMDCSPSFFEKLVVDLLLKMGYGGSRQDAGKAIGQTNDGGIDGIIKEDRLGLDIIYIQAKRWSNSVGRPEIQKFVGALAGQKAKKGVFITTSGFTKGAKDYVSTIANKIILINGKQLAQFMIDFNIGVSIENTYEIKKIDTDYFVDE